MEIPVYRTLAGNALTKIPPRNELSIVRNDLRGFNTDRSAIPAKSDRFDCCGDRVSVGACCDQYGVRGLSDLAL